MVIQKAEDLISIEETSKMPSLKFQNLPTSCLRREFFGKKQKFSFFKRPEAATRNDSRIFLKMEKISGNLLQKIPKFQFHSLHSWRGRSVWVRPLKRESHRCSYFLKGVMRISADFVFFYFCVKTAMSTSYNCTEFLSTHCSFKERCEHTG